MNITMRYSRLPGLLIVIVGVMGWTSASAIERVYYVAAEEVEWDYAPEKRNIMLGRAFNDAEKIFVTNTPALIGSVYKKAMFIEYEGPAFRQRKARTGTDRHLGILGPLMHAEVGDTIRVVFKNLASRPYSMHPHGVFYAKNSEGAPYNDGTSGQDKADDAVAPGATHTYIWDVPERAGPASGDPDSIGWLYHSHRKSIKDSNAGLVGAIVVTRAGRARADGRPADVAHEFVNLFTVFNENESWYLEDNVQRYTHPDQVNRDSEAFFESNLMHAINGYVYGNLPAIEMEQCDKVRWYVMALGTEVDLHTPHWHGTTGVWNGNRVDVVELLPGSTKVVDMVADNPGIWMYHCHVNDHIRAGMTALYTIRPNPRQCGQPASE